MRKIAAAAVTFLAAVALVAGLPGMSSSPADAATGDDVTVSVAPAASGVIEEGDDLKATITVTNGTDDDLGEGAVRLYLDRATFASRDQIESWFDRSPSDVTDALGSFMTTVTVPALAAGSTSASIPVTIPESTLSFAGSDWGAKAFGARYSADGIDITEAHSSVVYYPNDSFEPTGLAIAVPITVPESTSGLISAEALASYTSRNGILTQELDAVRGRTVALGIDPMILASIRILGNVAPPSAVEWLHRLETSPNQTFALAYADSDISGTRQAGATTLATPIDFDAEIAAQQKSEPDSYTSEQSASPASDTPSATATSGSGTTAPDSTGTGSTATPDPTATTIPPTSEVPTTDSLLAFDYTQDGVAWPIEGTVASDDLPVFSSSGYSTTILSSTNVKSRGTATENAATTIGGRGALVSDSTLSGLLRDAVSAETTPEWRGDIAELSAELATLTHERPSDARSLFATVGRDWATTGSRLESTLRALSKLTWTKPNTLTRALSVTSSSASLQSKSAAKARVDALRPLIEANRDVAEFASALKEPAVVTAKERLRMLALSSNAWSGNISGLKTEITKAVTRADAITRQISVVDGSPINVLGDRSSLPISLQNDTDSAAVVKLRVVPSNGYLNVEKNDVAVTIQAKSRTSVTVPVQSVANGKVTLTLTLSSSDGTTISTPSQVEINVRAGWETLITLVFAAAVIALFGGGIYRNIRRRRRGRGATAGAAEAPAQSDTKDPTAKVTDE
ncbi:DUF6049 family protein [Frondihabitans sp. VKM Ac-2883]|uniref:DUF6049 family protein n=1 Tax=Frondihabitans sp. VKM Ac-2883 TaxID=2783823 RepID=UPI00188C3416|nr:DUF6049 family protein [Frondihabitans sp. VKM Ac-2883]MBF4575173.1 hypothetical protein [Frondihabitans sp. VKM Ac-2883]